MSLDTKKLREDAERALAVGAPLVVDVGPYTILALLDRLATQDTLVEELVEELEEIAGGLEAVLRVTPESPARDDLVVYFGRATAALALHAENVKETSK